MRDCPNCGSPVDGTTCTVCNPPTKSGKPVHHRKTIVIHDREISVRLCDHVDHGQPCSEIARFSQHPTGDGNEPKFCDKHFPPFRSHNHPKEPAPARFQHLFQVVQPTTMVLAHVGPHNPDVGPHNPLDRVQPGPLLRALARRMREPGEEG